MLTGLFFGLCNGIFDFLDLIFDDPCLPFRRKRDFLKLRVADNDGIVVAGCDAGAKTLSIGGFKVFLAGNEQLCIGVWNALVSDIKTIQQLLKNKGYYASTVDGLAGSGTYNAVISFQKASGLTADGMVGSATLNALNASSGGTSGQSHSITLPTDRNYLWAQKNPDIVKLVGNSGCSLVAVLNTANIYGPREFTPNEVLTACGNWGANGLNTWALPSKCNGKIDTSNYTHGGKEQATVFSAVKASIDNNLPIIIRLNSSDGKKTHFVTAIAYTGSCSSASSISVIDPAGGVIRTLEEAGTARNETVYGDYIATARRS